MMVSVPTASTVQSWLNGQKDCPSRQHLLQIILAQLAVQEELEAQLTAKPTPRRRAKKQEAD